jgi:hypothetical protein
MVRRKDKCIDTRCLFEMEWASLMVLNLPLLNGAGSFRLFPYSAKGNIYLTLGLSFVTCETLSMLPK